MKKAINIVIFSFLSIGNLFAQNIGVSDFKNKIDASPGIILDVRTQDEVNRGHIEGASFVDYYDKKFRQKISFIDKSKPIYVYCLSGGRSSAAARVLKEHGFNQVYNLNGGFRAWKSAGYHVTIPSGSKTSSNSLLPIIDLGEVLNESSFVLADFQTMWCAPCKKLAPIIDRLSEEYANRAKIFKIDIDQQQALAIQHKIQGVPVLILFKDGKEVWRHHGFLEEEELKGTINNYL